MRLAEVYPLVSSRSVARAFTYEVPDEVGKGAVVSIRFGRAAARGVVVETGVEAPAGVKTAPIESVLYELPPALVDLALWIADYYGSTPARALELVAPKLRARRGERRPTGTGMAGEAEPAELTDPQQRAVARIVAAMSGDGAHVLLAGATGSGKTEVYLQACAAALEQGRGAIVLVPEIALTPQTLGRFQARFGDRIAILHSGLSDAARRDERERIVSGEAPVVVGARSAVFAPLPRLALICVDEEHDASYKQESDPRYDARTVAAKRAALEGAVAIYGSATPRPESWERLERLELGARLGAPMPSVKIVDLRREAGYPLSAPLLAELGKLSEHGGKAILLLNRRGLAPAIHCRACGLSRRCGLCDVSLTLHGDARLHCHHCGYSEAVPEARPSGGSAQLGRVGGGPRARGSPAPPAAPPRPCPRRVPRAAPPSWPGSAPARSGWRRSSPSESPSSSGSGSTRTRRRSRARSAKRSTASPPPTGRCSSARRSSARAITSRASLWLRSSTRTPGSPSRTSAPRSARSSS